MLTDNAHLHRCKYCEDLLEADHAKPNTRKSCERVQWCDRLCYTLWVAVTLPEFSSGVYGSLRDEFDIDARGYYSNARRAMEERGC